MSITTSGASSRRTGITGSALALALLVPTALPAAPTSAAGLPPETDGTPTEYLRWQGDVSSATGAALSSGTCDVDGDDRDDLVVGAWFWDKAPNNNVGATYVILGADDVRGASLANPTSAGAVRIDGPAVANAFTGFAVGCLGDVNGDGFDDLGISYYIDQRAYVVLGSADFDGLGLDSLGDRGYSVHGGAASGNVGFALAPVGDVDDDGLDDFGVAEVAADTRGRTDNGRVWVIAGQDDITDVDLLAPAAGQVVATIDGAQSGDRVSGITAAGDVDGDGVDDMLLGSYTATPWGASVAVPGAAYVVFGADDQAGTAEVDLGALGAAGFAVRGPQRQRDRLGISVAAAGDLDGDGHADLLVGADGVSNASTGPRNGGAAVVLGSASTATVYTDPAAATQVYTCADDAGTGTCATPADVRARGFWIDGAVASDSTGYSVAGLDDVNGDDVPDLLLGAWGFDPANPAGGTFSNAGAAYVVFGRSGTSAVSLAALPATAGFRIDGTAAGDRFGRQVAAFGDLDGNGVGDFAVGADFANRGGAQAGEVTVALNGDLVSRTALSLDDADLLLGETATATATVTRPAGATVEPTGTVTFSAGGTSIAGCVDVPLVAGTGSSTATCAYTPATSGTADVVATYAGATGLAPSASAPVAVTAARLASTVAVRPVVGATYGTGWTLTADVGSAAGTGPTGTVTFTSGATVLGTAPVTAGAATLAVAGTSLRPGSAPVVATYTGDPTYATSTAQASVTIARASARVESKVRRTPIRTTRRGAVVVRVVDTVATTGTVVVTGAGKKTTATLRAAANGRVVVRLPRLEPGTYRITVRYSGSDLVRPATAAAVRLVVKR